MKKSRFSSGEQIVGFGIEPFTKIGRRIFTYDLNGNHLGWTYPPESDHAPPLTDTTQTYHI